MKDSKLIELFFTFSSKEVKAFQKSISQQRADVQALCAYLAKMKSPSNAKKLSKAVVFKAIYPNEVYNEKTIRYTMSFLFKELQRFLIWQELRQDDQAQSLALVSALRKRGVPRIFEKTLQETERQIEKTTYRNHEYYWLKAQLSQEAYEYSINQNRFKNADFQLLINYSSHYFIANKLKQAYTALVHQSVNNEQFDQALLAEVLAHVEEEGYADFPAIAIYYHGYKALLQEDGYLHHFAQLNELISTHSELFPKAELRSILTMAINFCIKQINSGNELFKQNLFSIYKEGLRSEVFIQNGHISKFTYKNIVASALGLNEFDWAIEFIEAYKTLLATADRTATYTFNLALLYFKQGKNEVALEMLQLIDTSDVLVNLNARRMQLRIYFDLGEWVALESFLDSFKQYLYRQKRLGYYKDLYGNLIRFTRKVMRLTRNNTSLKAQLSAEIEATKHLAERKWLLEKVNGVK